MIQLIVGLGNPGNRYAQTRHNVGVWLVEALGAQASTTLSTQVKFHGQHAKINIGGKSVHLLVPTTYMNDSGRAVRAVAQFYKIEPEAILVIHDELDLPCGNVRYKQGGGHGGHNGLRDIVSNLSSREFYRLRIGIDHPGHKDQVSDYVLHAPSKVQQAEIETAIDRAIGYIPEIITGTLPENKVNL